MKFLVSIFFEKELKKKNFLILHIRNDRDGEFIDYSFITYC